MVKYFMIGIICSCLIGCDNTAKETYIDTNSFDYKYSKTRFQMEGYNAKDSDTAARAIMKFNEAQKNRSR
jgi:hypothetical protein